MYVKSLNLANFRSWADLDLTLTPGITIFSGPNGHGKTNIVEAIGYAATLGSHRVSGDAPLVRQGHPSARIHIGAVNGTRQLTTTLTINSHGGNKAAINRSVCKSPREILGIVKAVLFSPEDLALVRGEPEQRRRFLDSLLDARFPVWAGTRSDYDKVLRQRNALLKRASSQLRMGYGSQEAEAALATLDAWDAQIARVGAVIMARRIALVEVLAPFLEEAYGRLAPSSRPAGMRYVPTIDDALAQAGITAGGVAADPDTAVPLMEAVLLQELAARRRADIERGTSTIGPHRDDVELTLGDQPVKGFASHGESWSVALSLRLAAFEWLRTAGTDPVLILDDVFAELDTKRRQALVALAHDAEQTIVTAAVGDDLPDELVRGQVRVLGVEAVPTGVGDERVSSIVSDSGEVRDGQ